MPIAYPMLNEMNTSRDFVETFGGYNHNLRIGEGEFYDMKNMTSSHYPILATRAKRGLYFQTDRVGFSPVAMFEKDGVCTIEVNKVDADIGGSYGWLFRRGSTVAFLGATKYNASVKRNVVLMGSYVIVFPDKIYLNLADIGEVDEDGQSKFKTHKIEKTFTSTEGTEITYSLCKMDGTEYTVDITSKTAPTENLTNGMIWLDTSADPATLNIYSEAQDMWVGVATTYIKIKCAGIGKAFDEYDGVRISGVTVETLNDLNNTMVIYSKGDDYIVVVGFLKDIENNTQTGSITIERIVPEMDYVIESNNRLWGCRYGLNRDGEVVNEIYASKQGDFKNWECYPGLSTDSYTVSLGADGEFTGAISYLGYPVFFRQDCIHTVVGNYPATYQLQTTNGRGVQAGCHNSLAIVDGVLYYKAVGGVCAYTGSFPTEVGLALGEDGRRYYGAYAGGFRHKYYIGMRDALSSSDSTWLYVYDTTRGLWHKEDEYNGEEFCYIGTDSVDRLLYLTPYDESDDNYGYNIMSIIDEGTTFKEGVDYGYDEKFDWFVETGALGCSYIDKKYISRISLRLSIGIGTRVRIFAEYDSSGSWEPLATITGTRLGTFTLPVRPRRCDHLRLRIEGDGEAKIFSISKTLEQGSDI